MDSKPPPEDPYPFPASYLWLALGVAVAGLILFSYLGQDVLEGETQQMDEQIRQVINSHAAPALTVVMEILTTLGAAGWLLIGSALVLVGFKKSGRSHAAFLFAISMGGGLVLDECLKLAFHRARPVPFFGMVAPSSYSFPSGHSLLSLCFYLTLAIMLSARMKSGAQQVVLIVLAFLLSFAIGFSRIYLGFHYPSDVVAGFAASLAWVCGVGYTDYRMRNRRKRPTE